jgi:hypothetical protein
MNQSSESAGPQEQTSDEEDQRFESLMKRLLRRIRESELSSASAMSKSDLKKAVQDQLRKEEF